MTGSNHVVAGALIGAVVVQPVVAVPVALASHFIMDALPHYGDNNKSTWLNRHFDYVLAVDATITLSFLITLLAIQPTNWVLMLACAVIAVLPDVVWLPHYLADMRGQTKPHGRFARFSKWIQWGERPWGIYIEAIVLIGLLALFIVTVR